MHKIIKILGIIFILDMLAACQPQTDNSDLEAWIAEINSRPPGRVEPVPESETGRPALNRELIRDPFNPSG